MAPRTCCLLTDHCRCCPSGRRWTGFISELCKLGNERSRHGGAAFRYAKAAIETLPWCFCLRRRILCAGKENVRVQSSVVRDEQALLYELCSLESNSGDGAQLLTNLNPRGDEDDLRAGTRQRPRLLFRDPHSPRRVLNSTRRTTSHECLVEDSITYRRGRLQRTVVIRSFARSASAGHLTRSQTCLDSPVKWPRILPPLWMASIKHWAVVVDSASSERGSAL